MLPSAAPLTTSASRTGKVLPKIVAVVDDDGEIARALGAWFAVIGLDATLHASAESLLAAIRQEDNALVVGDGRDSAVIVGAILDVDLPGMSGIELAHILRKAEPRLPLVLITALREEERGRFGALPAGTRCLKKPFDLDSMEDALFPLLH